MLNSPQASTFGGALTHSAFETGTTVFRVPPLMSPPVPTHSKTPIDCVEAYTLVNDVSALRADFAFVKAHTSRMAKTCIPGPTYLHMRGGRNIVDKLAYPEMDDFWSDIVKAYHQELAGMAEAMRNRAIPVRSRHARFIDTAGTGSSRAKTFNVSTAAAFVIAGAGVPVAKHGARAATSFCGSADVLEALGVNTAASPERVEYCLNEHGICFMFAPIFHVATARVAHVRRELGVRTTFNFLGPLANPASAGRRTIGVSDPAMAERVVAALRKLGVERALVFYGHDGLDELTVTDASTAKILL